MKNIKKLNYTYTGSAFGDFCIVWSEENGGPIIKRIFLPSEIATTRERIKSDFIWVERGSYSPIDDICEIFDLFLQSKPVVFNLDIIALEKCSSFQKKVLHAIYGVHRGFVSTYGRIAKHIGAPKAARAVGNALATNPFPIIIPCHRAVSSCGTLGGYRGGVSMKKALLALEGVKIDENNKIIMKSVSYLY